MKAGSPRGGRGGRAVGAEGLCSAGRLRLPVPGRLAGLLPASSTGPSGCAAGPPSLPPSLFSSQPPCQGGRPGHCCLLWPPLRPARHPAPASCGRRPRLGPVGSRRARHLPPRSGQPCRGPRHGRVPTATGGRAEAGRPEAAVAAAAGSSDVSFVSPCPRQGPGSRRPLPEERRARGPPVQLGARGQRGSGKAQTRRHSSPRPPERRLGSSAAPLEGLGAALGRPVEGSARREEAGGGPGGGLSRAAAAQLRISRPPPPPRRRGGAGAAAGPSSAPPRVANEERPALTPAAYIRCAPPARPAPGATAARASPAPQPHRPTSQTATDGGAGRRHDFQQDRGAGRREGRPGRPHGLAPAPARASPQPRGEAHQGGSPRRRPRPGA